MDDLFGLLMVLVLVAFVVSLIVKALFYLFMGLAWPIVNLPILIEKAFGTYPSLHPGWSWAIGSFLVGSVMHFIINERKEFDSTTAPVILFLLLLCGLSVPHMSASRVQSLGEDILDKGKNITISVKRYTSGNKYSRPSNAVGEALEDSSHTTIRSTHREGKEQISQQKTDKPQSSSVELTKVSRAAIRKTDSESPENRKTRTRYNKPASDQVSCILPSGATVRVSLDKCRMASGVLLR